MVATDDCFQQTVPICPYCKFRIDEWWAGSDLNKMDSGGTLKCPQSACGREFDVYLHIQFTTQKPDDDEDDDG